MFFVSYLNLPTCDVSTHFVICNEYREERRMEWGCGGAGELYLDRDLEYPVKVTAFYFGVLKESVGNSCPQRFF